jgi:hypothetical protein
MFRLLKFLPVVLPIIIKIAKDPRVKSAISKARGPKQQP